MKILFVSPCLSVQADAPLNSRTRAEMLSDLGQEVTLLAYPAEYPLQDRPPGCAYRGVERKAGRSGRVKKGGRIWDFVVEPFLVKRQAFRMARREGFDVICMHHAEPWMLFWMALGRRLTGTRPPLVVILPMTFYAGGFMKGRPLSSRMRLWLNHVFARWLPAFVHVVCETPHLRDAMGLTGRRRVHVIPEGYTDQIDRVSQVEARRQWGMPLDKRIVLLFGVASRAKGSDLLYEALEGVPPTFHVYVVGKTGGVYESTWGDLERLQQSGWRDALHVISRFVTEEEMSSLYAACDALIMPYRYGFVSISSNLRQAGEYGKAVLASDQYHFHDILTQYGVGLLFEPDNVSAIRQCLLEFAAQPDSWFETVREQSRQLVRDRSWKNIGRRYCALFEQVSGVSCRTDACDESVDTNNGIGR